MFGDRFPAIVVAGAAALALLGAGFSGVRTVVSSLPSTVAWPPATPLPVNVGSTIEQSFVAPACPLTHVRVFLARGPSVAARLTLELVAPAGAGSPGDVIAATSVIVPASGQPGAVSLEIPERAGLWRRTLVLRLHWLEGGPAALDLRTRPPAWPGQLRAGGAWLGDRTLAFDASDKPRSTVASLGCVLGGRRATMGILVSATALLLLTGALAGVAVLQRSHVPTRARWPRAWFLLPAGLALAGGLTWVQVVPPFEAPDEVAHLQYARYVATTAGLPREVPGRGSPWREAFYEWVQPPLHYVMTAALLRASGGSTEPPRLVPNPRSRVAGGPERTVYLHDTAASGGPARVSLRLIRAWSVVATVLVVLVAAILVREHLNRDRVAILAAGCLALIPQWSAALATAANDSTATLAAAVSTLAILRLTRGDPSIRACVGAGLLAGLALSAKLTTAFLVPMALVAAVAPGGLVRRLPRVAAVTAGVLAGTSWVLVHNLAAFGDPLARAFKRSVLEQSGFLALSRAQPGPFEAAFWTGLHGQVFEAFWARFGSLGAGPDAGSRVWWVYGGLTAWLVVLAVVGVLRAARPSGRRGDAGSRPNEWASLAIMVGVASGLGSWVLVNVLGREDVVVHWTPRHLLPLSPLLLVLAASGLEIARSRLGGPAAAWRAGGALIVLALGLGWVVSLRFAIQHLHLGY